LARKRSAQATTTKSSAVGISRSGRPCVQPNHADRELRGREISDQAWVLETGEVALAGTARALADDPRVVETYLGLGDAGA
jgi:ABC-type lipopolysaccharide export system ATPase subunit